MNGINSLIVSGNIGSSKLIEGKEGKEPKTAVSVAVNNSYKNGAGEWINNVQWVEGILSGDRTATLTKGRHISLQGQATIGAYTNGAGEAVGTLKIYNAHITYLDKKEVETETVTE